MLSEWVGGSSGIRMNDGRQPNHHIHAGHGEGAAASAKGFRKAVLQIRSVEPGDAAPGFKVSEAQEAPIANPAYQWPQAGNVAAMLQPQAALRRGYSRQTS